MWEYYFVFLWVNLLCINKLQKVLHHLDGKISVCCCCKIFNLFGNMKWNRTIIEGNSVILVIILVRRCRVVCCSQFGNKRNTFFYASLKEKKTLSFGYLPVEYIFSQFQSLQGNSSDQFTLKFKKKTK